MSICSLKSDNRNTAVRRPPCVKGAVTVGDWGIAPHPGAVSGLAAWCGRSAGVSFSAMRKRRKNRQRRGLPPPCGIHPAIHRRKRGAFQSGPKGSYHTKRESSSPLLVRCWDGAPFSCFRPYLRRTPADGGRARPLHPDLRPWWKEWKLPAE